MGQDDSKTDESNRFSRCDDRWKEPRISTHLKEKEKKKHTQNSRDREQISFFNTREYLLQNVPRLCWSYQLNAWTSLNRFSKTSPIHILPFKKKLILRRRVLNQVDYTCVCVRACACVCRGDWIPAIDRKEGYDTEQEWRKVEIASWIFKTNWKFHFRAR